MSFHFEDVSTELSLELLRGILAAAILRSIGAIQSDTLPPYH